MRNQILKLGALVLFLMTVSCEKQEQAETLPSNYFVTDDLSFLTEGQSAEGAKGWPENGCRDIDVKVKLGFLEAETTVTHCCVNYVCNLMSVNRVIDFFLGNRSGKSYSEIEIISSKIIKFKNYDIGIQPGTYQLDAKTNGLRNLKYEVWVNP